MPCYYFKRNEDAALDHSIILSPDILLNPNIHENLGEVLGWCDSPHEENSYKKGKGRGINICTCLPTYGDRESEPLFISYCRNDGSGCFLLIEDSGVRVKGLLKP